MKIGLPTVIQYVLRGGYNFICLLSKASFARRQIKNPALRAGLFIVPFTVRSSNEILVDLGIIAGFETCPLVEFLRK